MALGDRDYMRNTSPSGPLRSATFWLVVINVVVFLLWQWEASAHQKWMFAHFTVDPTGLLEDMRFWTLFTAAFSHMEAWHLFFNMCFLVFFGVQLEAIYGRRDMVWLYLFTGLGCSLAHVGLCLIRDVPALPMLGASGSVMGIVVVTLMFFPSKKIRILPGLFPFPLWAIACLFLLMDVSGLVQSMSNPAFNDGIAHAGHLGGAAAGALFKLLDLRLFASKGKGESDLGPGLLARVSGRRAVGHADRHIPLDDRLPDAPQPRIDPALSARVDDLLRKINDDGIDSLTAEEKGFLERASRRYRDIEK